MKGWMLVPGAALAALAAGCATTGDSGPGGSAQCEAGDVQRFVGQKATGEIGQELLRITGARQLRWGPPRTPMTMDFRQDRLTVSYDDNMVIDRVSCG